MRLEDLRGLHVGDSALFFPGEQTPVAAAFHHHAEQAQWHTLNCLVRLSGDQTDGVANERIALVEWWRTIESLIALIHTVAVLESDQNLRPGQPELTSSSRDGVLDRWTAIARWFSGGTDSPPKATTKRLTELRDVRNSFEHTSRQGAVTIKHSRLGPIPAYANLADVMEALAICVEVVAVLRYVIADHDLMPQCIVPSQRHVFYCPLDEMATELVFPLYHRVVQALGLSSDVNMYPMPRPLLGESTLKPAVYIKALPDQFDVVMSKSLGVWNDLEAFANSRPDVPSSDHLRLPAYARASASADSR